MSEPKIKWREAFIEITLRAFRKLHIEYGAWGLGQATMSIEKWGKLNHGPGVELALETDICAAISREFINSPFTNGIHLGENDETPRRYEIEREVTFCSHRLDILINRYITKNGRTFCYKYPSFIEAKRAYNFTPRIASGTRPNATENITGAHSVQQDIKRLRQYRTELLQQYTISAEGYCDYNKDSKLQGAFLYLLVWGVYSIDSSNSVLKQSPYDYFEKVEPKLVSRDNPDNHKLRWMPLRWKEDNRLQVEVTEWLWIMLVEVDQSNINFPSTDFPDNWFEKK